MILLLMSQNLMYITDRIILAKYSVTAMYASIIAGQFVALVTWILVGIASASEIFVGQYNGQKLYDKLAMPVWQMIWLSLASISIFLPIGYFSEYLHFLPDYAVQDGLAYQKPLFYFGFLPSLIAGISAFFVGQGKTKIITIVSILGNAVNGILSYYLVISLGWGAKGAAIGTILSEFLQLSILVSIFLNSNHRNNFKTWRAKAFNKQGLIDCCKVGTPISIGHFFTILAWYLVAVSMGYVSKELGTVWSIAVNIYVMISFIIEGLNKSMTAIASNMIGKNDLISIQKIYRKFMLVVALFVVILSVPMMFFQDLALDCINLVNNEIAGLNDQIMTVLQLEILAFGIEAGYMIIYGILISGGDSRYPMLVTQGCMWIIMIIPLGILYSLNKLYSVDVVYYFMMTAFAINFILLYRRYKSNKWFKIITT
jgi:MATE family multidrug resistance protein